MNHQKTSIGQSIPAIRAIYYLVMCGFGLLAYPAVSLADSKIADAASNLGTTAATRTPDGVLEVVGGGSGKPSFVVRGSDSSASSGTVVGGATPSMIIQADGGVGIGTLQANAKLHVVSSANLTSSTPSMLLSATAASNVASLRVTNNTGHNYLFGVNGNTAVGSLAAQTGFFGAPAANNFAFVSQLSTSPVVRAYLNSNVGVGIGTTSVSYPLVVAAPSGTGNGVLVGVGNPGGSDPVGGAFGVGFRNSGAGAFFGYHAAAGKVIAGDGKRINFFTEATTGTGDATNPSSANNVPRMTITNGAGYVGIGTMTPNAQLDVYDSTQSVAAPITVATIANKTGAFDGTNGPALHFFNTDAILHYAKIAGLDARSSAGDSNRGDLAFYTRFHTGGSDGGFYERLRVTSAGKVGIGTSSPTSMLTVNGGVSTLVTASGAATTYTMGTGESKFVYHGGTAITVVIPAASTAAGRMIDISNAASNSITLETAGGATYGLGTESVFPGTRTIPARTQRRLWSDGVNWMIF